MLAFAWFEVPSSPVKPTQVADPAHGSLHDRHSLRAAPDLRGGGRNVNAKSTKGGGGATAQRKLLAARNAAARGATRQGVEGRT